MSYISKEAHVHLISALFLFFLEFYLTSFFSSTGKTLTGYIYLTNNQNGKKHVNYPSPPRTPRSRTNNNLYLCLAKSGLTVACCYLYLKGVMTSRNISITGYMSITSIYPVVIVTLHLVIIMYTFELTVVKCTVRQAERVLIIIKNDTLATVKSGFYFTFFSWTNQLIMYL